LIIKTEYIYGEVDFSLSNRVGEKHETIKNN